ncbi:MAG: hypothetical protein V8R80_07585 [Eubacterium sp.]
MLIAIQNAFRESRRKKGIPVKEASGCLAGDCAACNNGACSGRVFTVGTADTAAKKRNKEERFR